MGAPCRRPLWALMKKAPLTVTKAFCTWGEVHAKGNVSSVLFGLDSYAEMDFVSIELVRSQGLKPCNRKNHSHKIPSIEAAGCLAIKTYGVYHLHCTITDRWGRQFSFARPFIAMDRGHLSYWAGPRFRNSGLS